jgi:hypothetical protein
LWTTIDNYPSACSAGQYVSAIGDTLTCSAPTGGGTVTGTGIANTITKWTNSTNLGNSTITDDGQNVTIGTGTTMFEVNSSGTYVNNLTVSGVIVGYNTTTQLTTLYALKSEPIASSLGNWSADKASYTLLTVTQGINTSVVGNSSVLSTLQTSVSGNDTALGNRITSVNNTVFSLGNWTADKALYATLTNLASIGNWTNDKPLYYNTSQTNSIITSIGNYTANGMPKAGGNFTGNVTMNSGFCLIFASGGSICE